MSNEQETVFDVSDILDSEIPPTGTKPGQYKLIYLGNKRGVDGRLFKLLPARTATNISVFFYQEEVIRARPEELGIEKAHSYLIPGDEYKRVFGYLTSQNHITKTWLVAPYYQYLYAAREIGADQEKPSVLVVTKPFHDGINNALGRTALAADKTNKELREQVAANLRRAFVETDLPVLLSINCEPKAKPIVKFVDAQEALPRNLVIEGDNPQTVDKTLVTRKMYPAYLEAFKKYVDARVDFDVYERFALDTAALKAAPSPFARKAPK